MRSIFSKLIVLLTIFIFTFSSSYAAEEDFFGMIQSPFGGYRTDIEINSNDHIFEATWGGGVYRSTNYGTNYTAVNNGLDNLYVNDIFIFGTDIYVATTGGVFKSTDNADSWSALNNGLTNLYVQAVFVDSEGNMYAGTRGNGVFISDDGGQNWAESNFGIQYRDINSFIESRTGNIIAGSYGGGIFRSEDRGQTWVESNSGVRKKYIHDFCNDLAGDLLVATNGQGILLSVDNGATWSPVDTTIDHLAATDIVLNDRGEIVFGTRTGEIWYEDTQVTGGWETALPFFKDGVTSLAMNSNGTLYATRTGYKTTKSVNNGRNWTDFYSISSMNNVVGSYKDGIIFATTNDGILHFSDNYGESWSQSNLNRNNIKAIKFDSAGNAYVHTFFEFFRSENMGTTWDEIILIDSAGPVAWAVEPGGDIFVVLRDTNGCHIYVSTNNGIDWELRKTIFDCFTAHLAAGLDGTVYLAYSVTPEGETASEFNIEKTVNNGVDWELILQKDYPFYALAVDQNNVVYAGNHKDIYYSLDAGATWAGLNFKAGEDDNALIKDMVITRNNEFIVNTESLELFYYSENVPGKPDSMAISHGRSKAVSLIDNPEGDVYFWTTAIHTYVNPESIEAPELVEVENNAGDIGHQPAFSWEASTKAHMYQFQLATDEDFEDVIEEVVSSDLEYQITSWLGFYSTYYWRVRGKAFGSYGPWSEEWHFTTLLEPPVLLSPINESKGLPAITDLAWYRVKGATKYHVQVALDPDFDNIVFENSATSDSSTTTTKLEYLTTYYWRVRASNQDGYSDWSETWNFETVVGQPTLVYPADGARDLYPDITFKWETTEEATTYFIQLATDEAFDNVIFESEAETDTSHNLKLLDYNSHYYWRVRASNEHGTGDWTLPWDFTTGLEEITLLTPVNDTYCFGSDTLLTWQANQDADSYWLEVASDENFSNIIVDEKDITDTEYEIKGLDKWTPYWWRVRAMESDRIGFMSEEWKFMTGLPAQELLLPANNSDENPLSLTLKWKKLYGATKYHVQVATDDEFINIITDNENVIVEQLNIDELQNNTIYYWRVRGFNDHVTSEWSPVWNFKTELETSIVLAGHYKQPFKGSVYPNPANEKVEISFTLPAEQFYTISIFDLSGKELAIITSKWGTAGLNKISWQPYDIPMGSYFIRISSASENEVIPLQIVK